MELNELSTELWNTNADIAEANALAREAFRLGWQDPTHSHHFALVELATHTTLLAARRDALISRMSGMMDDGEEWSDESKSLVREMSLLR